MSEARVNLGLQLLDDQLIDSDGTRCGRVDDVELKGGVGKGLRVDALLAGSGAWAGRVSAPASKVVPAVFASWMVRIAWSAVDDVSTAVKLSRTDRELGIGAHDGSNVRWVNEEVPDSLLLSSLIGRQVIFEDEKLGRVWDVRAEARPEKADSAADQRWEVAGLLVGRPGLLQRLGIVPGERLDPPDAHPLSGLVAWDRVQSLDDGTIVCA